MLHRRRPEGARFQGENGHLFPLFPLFSHYLDDTGFSLEYIYRVKVCPFSTLA